MLGKGTGLQVRTNTEIILGDWKYDGVETPKNVYL